MSADAGYSGKPLATKLGFQPKDTVYLLNAPDWFATMLHSKDVTPVNFLPATWAHSFFKDQAAVATWLQFTDLAQIEKGFWLSWPKKASKIPTDLTEQTFRDFILPLGWVDTKVAAIDATWSALKFLRRKK